jgi:hypothetical protein
VVTAVISNREYIDGLDVVVQIPNWQEAEIESTIEVSQVLSGLSIALVEQAIERLATETNTKAANWLMQQLQKG